MKSFATRDLRLLVVGTLIGLFPAMAWAQDAAASDEELVTKVYPVADLVFTPPNYPYLESQTAGRATIGGGGLNFSNEAIPASGGGFGGGGFGGGGGGGFGGGFSVPDQGYLAQNANQAPKSSERNMLERAAKSRIDELIDVIVSTVSAQSWDGMGGPGTIMEFSGNRLIVCQTAKVHKEIQTLLNALRATGSTSNTVTVRAWWLRLDNEQYQKLLADMPPSSPPLVNRKQLESLAAQQGNDYGEVTCFDGQTVHIISGRFRNIVSGLVPVVGQVEERDATGIKTVELATVRPTVTERAAGDSVRQDLSKEMSNHLWPNSILAQAVEHPVEGSGPGIGGGGLGGANEIRSALGQEGLVGYQPIITKRHAGALLEFTPTRLPESKAIVLDLRSNVSGWREQSEKQVNFRNMPLDQTNVLSQQLATTLKVPLATPVLVGGLSLEPGGAAEKEKNVRLYLIVEAIDGSKDAPNKE